MQDKIVGVLKDLMSFKTYQGNKKDFDKLFNYVKDKYKSLFIKEYEFDGNKALVLSNCDSKNFDYIFCCHVDVVPISNYDYREDEDNIYGRGAIDMKGSVAVCLEVMKNVKSKKKIALFLTSDEEVNGNCAYQLLKIYNGKFALIPDGGSNFDLIKEEKGLLQIEISIKTKSAHASQPFNGVNAIDELYKVYNEIIKIYPIPCSSNEYITSVNLSKINGGDKVNKVPDFCTMTLDIRYTSKNSKEEILENIKKINKNVNIKVIFENPIFKTDLNNIYVKNYLKVCENVLNRPVNIIGCESTSDAIFFSLKKIPTVIMNPDGYYAHCDKEYVNKKSLLTLYNIYKSFIEGSDNI